MGRYRLGFAVALVVFALDQIMKWIVTGPMGMTLVGDEHYFLPIFSFTLTHNDGISLGLLNATNPLGRWMLGACAARWEKREARWQRAERLGVIAGTLPLGLGRALGALPGDNDGVVCVDETTVEGMSDRALVPAGHSMLAVSGRVSALVEHFLGTGRFA